MYLIGFAGGVPVLAFTNLQCPVPKFTILAKGIQMGMAPLRERIYFRAIKCNQVSHLQAPDPPSSSGFSMIVSSGKKAMNNAFLATSGPKTKATNPEPIIIHNSRTPESDGFIFDEDIHDDEDDDALERGDKEYLELRRTFDENIDDSVALLHYLADTMESQKHRDPHFLATDPA
ncbi:hypothetical protein M422DRAFT_242230 [Sphaerobolus stellatus SS14]|nr:hypothetical protein M422DRAFT_242230 [Sphaerobolus stellatus SS14]